MFEKNKNVLSRERNGCSNIQSSKDNKKKSFKFSFDSEQHPKLKNFLFYGACAALILNFFYNNVNFEYHDFRADKHIVAGKDNTNKPSIEVKTSEKQKSQKDSEWLGVFKPVPNGYIYVARHAYNTEILSLHDHMSNNDFYRLAVFKFSDGFYEVFFRHKNIDFVPEKTLWFSFPSEKAIDALIVNDLNQIVSGKFSKETLDEKTIAELEKNNGKDKFFQFVKILGY